MRSLLLHLFTLSLLFFYVRGAGSTCSIVPASAPYKLSVCTMIHNEANYIEEWLAYHLLLKVDHFFIYNDRSTDNIEMVLAPYIKLGVVTLLPWGKENKTITPQCPEDLVPLDPKYTRSQRYAIADCLYNHVNESEWFGVWDVDEFPVLNKFFPDMKAFMPFAEVNGDDYMIPMTIYGTSSHSKTPSGLVLKEYQQRTNITKFGVNIYDGKFNGKSMYKAGCGKPNVHFTNELNPGCRKYRAWLSAEGSYTKLPLSINHYPVKSWDHFEQKMQKWRFGLDKEEFDEFEAFSNEEWDDTMVEYVAPVQKIMDCMRDN